MRLSRCCDCYSLLLVTGVFYNCASTALQQLPPKCCPQNQDLVFKEDEGLFTCSSEAVSERVLCHPPFYLDSFSSVSFPQKYYYFPECEEDEALISIRAEQGNKISCLDKVLMDGVEKYVGLLCFNGSKDSSVWEIMEDEDSLKTFDVPDVFTLNKCCPLERSYSGYVNGCWDQRVPDNKTYLQGLVVARTCCVSKMF